VEDYVMRIALSKLIDARERAQRKANGQYKAPIVDPEDQKAKEMGYAYEQMMSKYFHNPSLRYFKSLSNGLVQPCVKSFLSKAVFLAEQANVSYDVYVKAQFYWFDKWFRRHPKINELCSIGGKRSSIWRIQEFLKIEDYNNIEVSSVSIRTVTMSYIDDKTLDKINRSRLNQVCKAYNLTEEEAFSRFAPTGLFDLEWLKRQRKVGKKLREEGLI
jgi:hypothetical protein